MLRQAALRLVAGRACAAGPAVLAPRWAAQSQLRATAPSTADLCVAWRGAVQGLLSSERGLHAWAPQRRPDNGSPAASDTSTRSASQAVSADEDHFAAAGAVFRAQRVLRLREAIREASEVTPTIDMANLENICTSEGFASDSENMIKALQKTGEVLVVKDKVFLRPDRVVRAALLRMDDQCEIAAGRPPAEERLRALELIKAQLDLKAERRTKVVLTGILGVLFAQLAVFIRLTYWELSWDTMEPAGFFYMSTISTMGQIYFLIHREEFSNESFRDKVNGWFRTRLYRKALFDAEAYEELRERVEEAKAAGGGEE